MKRLWDRIMSSSPFFLMAGPNVLQSREHALRIADKVATVKEATGLEVIFKVDKHMIAASFQLELQFFLLCHMNSLNVH